MNLKDRLSSIKNNNSGLNKTNFIDESEILSSFDDLQCVKDIVNKIIKEKNNIIFICDKSCNKMLISNYLKQLSDDSFNVNIIDNIEKRLPFFNSGIKIIPNPEISEVVKILEYIIFGYKSFIFGLNFSSFTNILEKLMTVIAINFPNLTEININTLIGSASLYFVCISKNIDGIMNISRIEKVNYMNGHIGSEEIFSSSGDISKITQPTIPELPETEQFYDVLNNINNIESNDNEIIQNDDIKKRNYRKTDIKKKSTPEKKINKYKLLKEKVKKKRLINNK